MDSILKISAPTKLHAITQCIELLTMQDLTPAYIKLTNHLCLSLPSS